MSTSRAPKRYRNETLPLGGVDVFKPQCTTNSCLISTGNATGSNRGATPGWDFGVTDTK